MKRVTTTTVRLVTLTIIFLISGTFAAQQTQFARIGTAVTIRCPVEPPSDKRIAFSSIRWVNDNTDGFIAAQIPDGIKFDKYIDSGKYTVHSIPALTIHDVTLSDEGTYRCTVTLKSETGEEQQAHGMVHLTIHIPFKLSLGLSETSTEAGNVLIAEKTRLSATCKTTSGRPKTTFTWYFNGQPISNNRHFRINDENCVIGIDGSFNCTSQLVINKMHVRYDGNYTCKAEIPGLESGVQTKTFSLQVKPSKTDIDVQVDEPLSENAGHSLRPSTLGTWVIQIFLILFLQRTFFGYRMGDTRYFVHVPCV
ncbi:protein turtle homolog B-like [Glandiceps talaboti]